MGKVIIREVFSWIVEIAGALALGVALNIFVFQITAVSGESMMQTLHDKDIYITSKIGSTLNHYPHHEEIVIIDSRVSQKRTLATDIQDIYRHNLISTVMTGEQPKEFWVKRVIGLPGDSLRMENGTVYRNGEALSEPYVNSAETPRYSGQQYTVPDGYVFVMGDNRNHSSDSRVIGLVPIENVIGSVKFRLKSGV